MLFLAGFFLDLLKNGADMAVYDPSEYRLTTHMNPQLSAKS